MKQRIAFSAAFWLAIAGMGIIYLSTPSLPSIYQRYVIPWYRSVKHLAQGTPEVSWLSSRHARHAIFTRNTLPPQDSGGNAAWFARWNQSYLAYQRGEMNSVENQIAETSRTCEIDMYQQIIANKARLTDVKIAKDADGSVVLTVKNNSVIDMEFAPPISTREFDQVVLKWDLLIASGGESGPCVANEFCRIIWVSDGRGAPNFEEQTAIQPLGILCEPLNEIRFDLSRRYDWYQCGKVKRMYVLFTLNGPLDIVIKP